MEWAPVVIKEIIAAFRQQHSAQDNEKLKNIVREVMTENINREQNKLLCEIMTMLNKNSVRSSREVDRNMERDQLRDEYEKLAREMERLMQQDKRMDKKQESINDLSHRQKILLQRVNELKKGNAGKGRSQSRHRNANGDGKPATNQSQGQQQGQPHSRGAFSKYKHQHPAMKGKANSSFPGNSNDGSRVYPNFHHPPPSISGQNTYGQPGRSTDMNAFQQYQGAGVSHQHYHGQQQYQGPGDGPQQYHSEQHYQGARGGQQQYQGPEGGPQQYHGQQHYQGARGGQQQYQGPEGGPQQYPHPNPQGFLQYQQKSRINQPYSPNPAHYYQLLQDGQQQQPQFGKGEPISQQPGGHQQFHHRGQFNKRGQFQHRGQFQQRGQFQHRGQFHHREGFHQQRHNFQPKDKMQITDDDSLMSQFTAEDLNALKEIIKKKQQAQQEENKDAKQGSHAIKKKQKKRPGKSQLNKGEAGPQKVNGSDDDDNDTEDDLDEVKKRAQDAYKAQLEAMESEKNKTVQDGQGDTKAEELKAQNIEFAEEATENKEEAAKETSTDFNLCVASGLDVSKMKEGPEMDALLSSMVLVAKSGGKPVSCHPKTIGDVLEFKKKYPNAEALVLK